MVVSPLVEALIAERKRQGISQREVTRRLGTSSADVSLWERGLSRPRLDHLERWAAALGMTLTISRPPA